MIKVLDLGITGKARIWNNESFGEIGSSRSFFHDLAYTVIEVMVRDKIPTNYNVNPPFKKVLEQSF
ncbi:MAG: hypothetical protein PT120_24490 [Aphanizomenon gracile PMC649.10]|nr:hypothetical protein [Aphanizomenon gracile PMC649.10]